MLSLNQEQINSLAHQLYQAEQTGKTIAQLHDMFPELTLNDAYAIQDALKQVYCNSGRIPVGYKMGLTNTVKMQQMGVTQPLRGYLFQDMLFTSGSELPLTRLIQPKVEMEIAFVLAHAVSGTRNGIEDILAATAYITPALEIVDSRYPEFKFAFADGIADNICADRVVLGQAKLNPRQVNLADIGVELLINGKSVVRGNSSAVLSNPLNSIVMLANMLGARGEILPAGSVIISGAIADAITFNPEDQINAEFGSLGTVGVRIAHR